MRRFEFTKEQVSALVECSDYRSLAGEILAIRANSPAPLTYAQIGRSMGVKARSYPRDILTGKKKLTPRLMPRMAKALGLTGELKRLFELLVELGEPNCRTSGFDEAKLRRAVEAVKNRILQKELLELRFEEAYELADIPRIYASLGSQEQGATLREISARSGFPLNRLTAALARMQQLGLLQEKQKRFFPLQPHVNTAGMQSEIFQRYFQKVTEEVQRQAREDMQSDEKLFFSSAFSVDKRRLAELKTELRSLLLKYVDQSEDPHGDRVASILCALC